MTNVSKKKNMVWQYSELFLFPITGSARRAGVVCVARCAEGRAATRESINEVVAHGDAGVMSVPDFFTARTKRNLPWSTQAYKPQCSLSGANPSVLLSPTSK